MKSLNMSNAMTGDKKILLVEDDPNLSFVIKDNLGIKGYDVTLCMNGEDAEEMFNKKHFHLCILDVMLPKKDGFSLARSIRRKNDSVPILFLTAKSMTEDRLPGFESGADDYITKPFSLEELFYRVEVFLKRSAVQSTRDEKIFLIGNYKFDFPNLLLSRGEIEKSLTQKEAEILKILYHHRQRVLRREEILNDIWGNDDYFSGRSLDVFISKLRKYLRDDSSVKIVNYHGIGFKLETES